jgi:hypothetical protein
MAFSSTSSIFSSSASAKSRRGPRVTPDPLLIIRLPTGNHGIVLDLSEQGLGFLAASPIDEGRSIRFVLSDRSNRKSEATGQLMWKDAAGKRCGLQFTEVSTELREMIQSCLGQEDDPDVAGSSEPLPPSLVVPDSFPTQVHAGIFDDLPMPQRSPRRASLVANATTLVAAALIAFAIWYNLGGASTSLSLSRVRQHVSTFVFGKINHIPSGWTSNWTSKLKPQHAAPAAKKIEPPVEAASMHPVDAPLENSAAQSEPAAPSETIPTQSAAPLPPAPNPVSAPVTIPAPISNAPAAPKPAESAKPVKKDSESVAAQPNPQPVASAPAPVAPEPSAVERAVTQAPAPDDQVTQARKLLAKQDNPVDQSKGIQMLWQAVAKGNPAAEVELAGLYLRGRGVSKSCSQALVLLKAAQSKKNTAAAQELSNLPQFGCGAADESAPATGSSPNGAQ